MAATAEKVDVIDKVTLDHDARQRRRLRTVTNGGRDLFIDLAAPASLTPGDKLVLGSGSAVEVQGAEELLLEIVPGAGVSLSRIAWHLGNRHTPTQVLGDRLRIRADHVLAHMLVGLGATVRELSAVFEPETGAYAHGNSGHH
ncbi:MAG: urease accessory protein UreE [Geminicoccaceae bacterium]